jgi:hypothetical protein
MAARDHADLKLKNLPEVGSCGKDTYSLLMIFTYREGSFSFVLDLRQAALVALSFQDNASTSRYLLKGSDFS